MEEDALDAMDSLHSIQAGPFLPSASSSLTPMVEAMHASLASSSVFAASNSVPTLHLPPVQLQSVGLQEARSPTLLLSPQAADAARGGSSFLSPRSSSSSVTMIMMMEEEQQ